MWLLIHAEATEGMCNQEELWKFMAQLISDLLNH